MSAIDDLCELPTAAGVRVTFDRGRNINHHCTFCDAPGPHDLATIGRYLTGSELTRPVCGGCMPLVRAIERAAGVEA